MDLNRNRTLMIYAGGGWNAEGKTERGKDGEAGGVKDGDEPEGDNEEPDKDVAEGRDRGRGDNYQTGQVIFRELMGSGHWTPRGSRDRV